MQSVFKYTIPAKDCYFSLELPQGTKILTVQEQHHVFEIRKK